MTLPRNLINAANPAPLGLLGFGMTTVLLNMHNANFFSMDGMILAMGVFYGGIAQIIAGIMEWRKQNTFGMTAFVSYGLFWLSLVGILVIPSLGWAAKPEASAMAAYLLVWGLFTAIMFIATLKLNKVLQFVFGSLTLLFLLLALGDITGNTAITRLAGYEGIICGLSAIYLAAAEIINEVYKKKVLPM
ncbi:acetate uptake transporter [bacterium]|nr:acetate uptake transporter [bacterium]